MHVDGIRFVLASASPRRAELLRAAGFTFDVEIADVDESVHPGESPEAYVRRVADEKARAIMARRPDRVILAADTSVIVGSEILGKPEDGEDAARMLRLLSGRTHDVLTAVALRSAARGDTRVEVTAVTFAALTNEEIAWYVASGEPMDKAGAYAIQGRASRFITAVNGSYSNVVGLPVALVYRMLREGNYWGG